MFIGKTPLNLQHLIHEINTPTNASDQTRNNTRSKSRFCAELLICGPNFNNQKECFCEDNFQMPQFVVGSLPIFARNVFLAISESIFCTVPPAEKCFLRKLYFSGKSIAKPSFLLSTHEYNQFYPNTNAVFVFANSMTISDSIQLHLFLVPGAHLRVSY